MSQQSEPPAPPATAGSAPAPAETSTSTASTSTKSTPPPIDEIVALAISTQDVAAAKRLLNQLNSLNKTSLLSYTSDGLDPLTVMNPVTHSLAYLYFM